MRPSVLLYRLIAFFVFASPALAASQQDHRDCKGNDPDRSIAGCTHIIEDQNESTASRAAAANNRGVEYRRKGDFDRAVADYNEAIRLEPTYALAYYNRGFAYRAMGDYDRAIADYNEAIRLEPKDADAYNGRAWAYFKMGKASAGLPDADRALQLNPNNAASYNTRGHIYEALGRNTDAIADYRKALSINSSIQESKDGLKRLGAAP